MIGLVGDLIVLAGCFAAAVWLVLHAWWYVVALRASYRAHRRRGRDGWFAHKHRIVGRRRGESWDSAYKRAGWR